MIHCTACQQEYDDGVYVCAECLGVLRDGPLPVADDAGVDPLAAVGDVAEVSSSRSAADIGFHEGLLRERGLPTRVGTLGDDALGALAGTPDPIHVLFVPRDRVDEARTTLDTIREDEALDDSEILHGETRRPADQEETASRSFASTPVLTFLFALGFVVIVMSMFQDTRGPDKAARFAPDEGVFPIAQLGGILIAAAIGGGSGVWVARRPRTLKTIAFVMLLLWGTVFLANFVVGLLQLFLT